MQERRQRGGRLVFRTALSSAPRPHTRFLSTHPLLCISLLSYRRASQGGLALGRCFPPTNTDAGGTWCPGRRGILPTAAAPLSAAHQGKKTQRVTEAGISELEDAWMEVVRLLPMTGSCIISICKCLSSFVPLLHLLLSPHFSFLMSYQLSVSE